jgi:hypothetical protein
MNDKETVSGVWGDGLFIGRVLVGYHRRTVKMRSFAVKSMRGGWVFSWVDKVGFLLKWVLKSLSFE